MPQGDETVIVKKYKDIVDYISWWLTNKEFGDLNILNDAQLQAYDSHVKDAQSWFPPGVITVPLASPISTIVKPDIMEAKRLVAAAKEEDSFDRAFALVAAASLKLNKANDAMNTISQLSREHRKMFIKEMNTIAYKGDTVLGKKRDDELQNNPSGFDADEATIRITKLSRTVFAGGARRRHQTSRRHHHHQSALQKQQRHLLRMINLYAKQ